MENGEKRITLTEANVSDFLGPRKLIQDSVYDTDPVGVVNGLAYTESGGDLLRIETLIMEGTGKIELTGSLGDVMKESATIAYEYIKSHSAQLEIDPAVFEEWNVHIHVPEGAIPKDGPSAGITMTTALVSAFTGKKVRPRIAMTGEMTLRGKVLPIGGVKEKLLAAKRAGITDIVLCDDNRKDVEEIPEKYLKGLKFHYVKDIQEVIDFALLK